MKGKFAFVVGAAVGYVLGTRAGRERYEQIKRGAQTVWNTPPVQRGVAAISGAVQSKVDEFKASAVRAGKEAFAAFTKAGEDAGAAGSASKKQNAANAETAAKEEEAANARQSASKPASGSKTSKTSKSSTSSGKSGSAGKSKTSATSKPRGGAAAGKSASAKAQDGDDA